MGYRLNRIIGWIEGLALILAMLAVMWVEHPEEQNHANRSANVEIAE